MNRVLFVCTENSNRSQMAEGFSRMHAAGIIEPASAGSAPSGAINPVAVRAMSERGYDLAEHRPKGLSEVGDGPWDFVITMGCGDACPWVPARQREDWRLPDPKGMSLADLRAVRDEIEARVLDLKARVESD